MSGKRHGTSRVGVPRWAQLFLILAYGLALAWWIQQGKLPLETSFVAALLCVVTFIAYALDKHAAQTNAWRIPEANLHLLELAGGWPGALIAQQALRHKTSKRGYRIGFWLMVAMHAGILLCWIYRDTLLSREPVSRHHDDKSSTLILSIRDRNRTCT